MGVRRVATILVLATSSLIATGCSPDTAELAAAVQRGGPNPPFAICQIGDRMYVTLAGQGSLV